MSYDSFLYCWQLQHGWSRVHRSWWYFRVFIQADKHWKKLKNLFLTWWALGLWICAKEIGFLCILYILPAIFVFSQSKQLTLLKSTWCDRLRTIYSCSIRLIVGCFVGLSRIQSTQSIDQSTPDPPARITFTHPVSVGKSLWGNKSTPLILTTVLQVPSSLLVVFCGPQCCGQKVGVSPPLYNFL